MTQILRVSYDTFKDAAQIGQVYFYKFGGLDGYALGVGSSDFVYFSRITSGTDLADFAVSIQPSAVEVFLEGDVIAKPTLFTNNRTIKRFDIQDAVIYIGTAEPGTLDGQIGWTIKKFTFIDGNVTKTELTVQASAVWTNRTSEVYF